jgi:hypothetical protein
MSWFDRPNAAPSRHWTGCRSGRTPPAGSPHRVLRASDAISTNCFDTECYTYAFSSFTADQCRAPEIRPLSPVIQADASP